MTNMNDLMRSVELKFTRVKSQIESLDKEIAEWLSHLPKSPICKLREGRLGYQVTMPEYSVPPPLEHWGLLFGECIHNIRSALDNLAFALARLHQDPPTRPEDIQFPIFQEKEKFDRKRGRYIGQLPPEAALMIEQLQPFQRNHQDDPGTPASDPLVLLSWLNNNDKHRIPSVVLFNATEWSHHLAMKFYSDADSDANTPPDVTIWNGPISPGVLLYEWRTNCPIEYVEGAVAMTAVVSFQGESANYPLIQTLTNLHQYMAGIAYHFQQRFFL